MTVTASAGGFEVRGPGVATTVRVGGALSSLFASVTVVAASPVLITNTVAVATASDTGDRSATRRHGGERLLSATVATASDAPILHERPARRPVAMLLPQLDGLFAECEWLPSASVPGRPLAFWGIAPYEWKGPRVEVKIGVSDSPRDLVFNSSQTPAEVEELVTAALSQSGASPMGAAQPDR